jgi:hypothetical protein
MAYFKVLAGVLVKAGVAKVNPDFDENVPYSQPILIVHPERIFSYDETDVSLDQTSSSRAQAGRTVTAGAGDRGEVVATKSSTHITAIGGRAGPYALPIGVVFGSGDSFSSAWCGDPPIGNVIRGVSTKTKLPNGEETTTEILDWYAANKKGSMNTDLCGKYSEEVIMPNARHLNPGMANEDGKRSVEVCDGTQVHLGHERLQRCVEAGLEVVIRLPHSTHVTQGEDTVHFGVLKGHYLKSKARVLTKKRVGDDVSESQQAGRLLGDPAAVLKPEDLMTCLREPWEKAFSAENVKSAWAMDGIVPFTRKPYWDLRLEWEKRDQSIAAAAAAAGGGGGGNAPGGDEDGAAPAGGAGGQSRVGRARRRNAPRDEDGDSSDARGSSGEEDADEDDDAARAARPPRGRLTVCDPQIQHAIEDFTQSEEQPDIENMSQGALMREVLRSRNKKNVARKALKETVDNKIRRNAEKLTTAHRAKDLYRLEGGVTGAAAMAISEAAYRQKLQAENDRLRKLTEKVEKAKRTEQDAAGVWSATRATLEKGDVVKLDELSLATLKLLHFHFYATAKRLVKKDDLLAALLEQDSVSEDAITPALVKGREARDRAEVAASRASRQQSAQVPGRGHASVAPQPPPGAGRGGRGRGRGRGRGHGDGNADGAAQNVFPSGT